MINPTTFMPPRVDPGATVWLRPIGSNAVQMFAVSQDVFRKGLMLASGTTLSQKDFVQKVQMPGCSDKTRFEIMYITYRTGTPKLELEEKELDIPSVTETDGSSLASTPRCNGK